jgi:hypothetical protein
VPPIAGGAATLLSGEYTESWLYLLLDFGGATFGLVACILLAARLLPRRVTRVPAPARR